MRIVFVSHDASGTGAPNSLLNILGYFKRQERAEIRIILLRGGPLQDAFLSMGRTLVIGDERAGRGARVRGALGRIYRNVTERHGRYPCNAAGCMRDTEGQRRVNAFLSDFEPDVIYLNTIAAAPVLQYFEEYSGTVITYVRELREYIERTIATGWFGELVKRTSRFISVSEASKRYLVENHGIRPERFLVIQTFVDVAKLDETPRAVSKRLLSDRVGASDGAVLIVGCGSTDWRKGADLFLCVARAFFLLLPQSDTVFVWLGGMSSESERAEVQHDLRQSGLTGRVFFPGAQRDAATLLGGADVLALTSREDPFPRVMLEAGLAQVPTVCFKNSGGAEEFVANGCGISVEYLDVQGFALALRDFLQTEDLRQRLGAQARRTVIRDNNVAVSAARVFAEIRRVVENRPMGQ